MPSRFGSTCSLCLACLAAWPAAAATSGTSGQAWAGVPNASSASSNIEDPVFAADSIESANSTGAVATATFAASLASATLSTDVAATAEPANGFFNSATARVDALSFFDRLNFVIPAGTYTEPLVVRLYGFSLGSLFSEGCTSPAGTNCANGYHTLNLHAGSGYGQADFSLRRDVDAGTGAATDFNAFFTLDVAILNPTTLAAPTVSALSLTGSLITVGTAVGTYGYPEGALRTQFAGDAFAGFGAIEVPAGVVWTSDSGVFLQQPVPEPAPAAMLVAGLVTLAWLRRRQAGRSDQPGRSAVRP